VIYPDSNLRSDLERAATYRAGIHSCSERFRPQQKDLARVKARSGRDLLAVLHWLAAIGGVKYGSPRRPASDDGCRRLHEVSARGIPTRFLLSAAAVTEPRVHNK
jgi:hypothetical protein